MYQLLEEVVLVTKYHSTHSLVKCATITVVDLVTIWWIVLVIEFVYMSLMSLGMNPPTYIRLRVPYISIIWPNFQIKGDNQTTHT
jgi:hypothetical protein